MKIEAVSQARNAEKLVVRYVANDQFNQAVLFFQDGSYLQFEHKGLDKRWVQASAPKTQADRTCQSMRFFRLNALHLQLYFQDDSDVEFFVER